MGPCLSYSELVPSAPPPRYSPNSKVMSSPLRLCFLTFLLLWNVNTVYSQCQTNVQWKNRPDNRDSTLTNKVIYNGLTNPRGIKWIDDTLLVIESGVGLTALRENQSGCNGGWTKSTLVSNNQLNHGLVVNGTYIYASTPDVAYRYTWNPTSHTITGSPVTLITGINLAAQHRTRTLEISGQWLLVSSGSDTNLETASIDPARGTAIIRRFNLNNVPSGGYKWSQGETVAWGMRNAVGISLSLDGTKLWTVENSADQITYNQNGQQIDIHIDNPAEEVNVVDLSDINHYYGYPQCLTVWDMSQVNSAAGLRTGDQFSVVNNVSHQQCANKTFNIPPRLSMQAHSAPLDITFYRAPPTGTGTNVAVNRNYNTHAFVSFHGSWNRSPPIGYSVVRIPWSGDGPTAASNSLNGYTPILQAPNLSSCPYSCFRPVGLVFDPQGRLFGTSDTTGEECKLHIPANWDATMNTKNGAAIRQKASDPIIPH